MKLGDLIVFWPATIITTFAKTIRTNIPEEAKTDIERQHLYHCTFSKETADAIIKSQRLHPATGLFKNINSYGKAACCMFSGISNMDSIIKNMNKSPYVQPDLILHAVEINIKKEELENYKIRPFSDESILYEGYCILPKGRTRAVELVADLKRDEEGNSIINPETGKPQGIQFRLRTQEEIEKSPDKYIPSQDYIDFINEKKKEFGYLKGEAKISKAYNNISNIIAGGKLEYNEVVRSTKKNFFAILKQYINNFKNRNKLLDENSNTKIEKAIYGKSFLSRKNPYADKKFAIAVAEFQEKGLLQINLGELLPEFVNSMDGIFLRDKYEQIDKSPIRELGIHGIKHNNRVAMLALMIGQGEGILKEQSTRERELLISAAYYHDIGRIAPVGPHAKRSARLIKKTDLSYLDGKKFTDEDRRIVQLLAEGHEGKDGTIEKLFKKYDIAETDRGMVSNLLSVLKDADALDRSRLTINTPIATVTDLEPKYLRLDTSKKLMEASYGLEELTQKVNITDIQNYKNENPKEHYHAKTKKIDEIKVDEQTKEDIELKRQSSIQHQDKNRSRDISAGDRIE